MITTSLRELLRKRVIELVEEDACTASYNITDQYMVMAELEPDTWGEVKNIQVELDSDNPTHLILLDVEENATFTDSDKVAVRIFSELTDEHMV